MPARSRKPSKPYLVIATTNLHKVKEIKHIFGRFPVKLLSLNDFPDCPPVVENGKTFEANALKKARQVARFTGLPILADDSGLEVKGLGGRPGIRSARFAGPDAGKEELCRKVLRLMKKVPKGKRQARFVCCAVIVLPGGKEYLCHGRVKGVISDKMSGRYGFGYDPIFYLPQLKKTMAQLPPARKNRLSHRFKAVQKARKVLQRVLAGV